MNDDLTPAEIAKSLENKNIFLTGKKGKQFNGNVFYYQQTSQGIPMVKQENEEGTKIKTFYIKEMNDIYFIFDDYNADPTFYGWILQFRSFDFDYLNT